MTSMNGDAVLQEAIKHLNINLVQLVAETALWVNPLVFEALKKENGLGVWYQSRSRAKQGKSPIDNDSKILGDKNNYANYALKQALGLQKGSATNFHVCHIWDRSCYDMRHHTCVANLVLVPRAICCLTDYDELTKASLRFRSFELYGWYPEDEQQPDRPADYPKNWNMPSPLNQRVEATLKRRQKHEQAIK